ncbi:unnamed protein product [Closterium sp. Naga37s-1]|nr:unnamed protein product [Closterium sp. Naga37s-1]
MVPNLAPPFPFSRLFPCPESGPQCSPSPSRLWRAAPVRGEEGKRARRGGAVDERAPYLHMPSNPCSLLSPFILPTFPPPPPPLSPHLLPPLPPTSPPPSPHLPPPPSPHLPPPSPHAPPLPPTSSPPFPPHQFVVKKASEFGAAELWMNERVRRACPQACAVFVDGFVEKTKTRDNFWIVWRFEGNATFADVLQDDNFPYNVEKAVLGYVPREPKGPEREMRVIRTILKRILKSVDKLHSVGIVHRDIKPQNMIFNSDTGELKIIDLGAAADLRVGINYNPNEFLLDPRYAAPEQYIMSTQTPNAPPPTIAALLSPVLWQMNLPDRFDMYSVGIIFLQMVFPNLRTDSPLIQFNRQLKRCEYDLAKWREVQEGRALSDAQLKAFAMLDADGGHGWSLLQALVNVKPGRRISAAGAIAHPFFYPGGVPLLQQLRLGFVRFLYRDNTELSEAFGTFMSKGGTDEAGGFTEASLMEFKKREKKMKKSSLDRNALASMIKASRKVSKNVASSVSTTFGSSKEDGAKKEAWWNRWQSE